MKLFSKRKNREAVGDYSLTFEPRIRHRILVVIRQNFLHDFSALLEFVKDALLAQYGDLEADVRNEVPLAAQHFVNCGDRLVLDFLEVVFRFRRNFMSDRNNALIAQLNELLTDENIGFEITEHRTVLDENRQTQESKLCEAQGLQAIGIPVIEELPEVREKQTEFCQEHAIGPACQILRNQRFATANQEFGTAFTHLRDQRYPDAITSAAAAYESVLKVVLHDRGWPYDPGKDTISRLIDRCRDNGLIPSHYVEIFKLVGTLRNKLSSAHGRAKQQVEPPKKHNTTHLMTLIASNIILLSALDDATP